MISIFKIKNNFVPNQAIFGMNLFMNVKYDAGINEIFNFETIYRSIITLFPLITSAGELNLFKF